MYYPHSVVRVDLVAILNVSGLLCSFYTCRTAPGAYCGYLDTENLLTAGRNSDEKNGFHVWIESNIPVVMKGFERCWQLSMKMTRAILALSRTRSQSSAQYKHQRINFAQFLLLYTNVSHLSGYILPPRDPHSRSTACLPGFGATSLGQAPNDSTIHHLLARKVLPRDNTVLTISHVSTNK